MAEQKKRLSKTKIKAAKRNLRLIKKQNNWSLRDLSGEIEKRTGGKISRQALGRFIKEKDYVPANDRERTLLDLYITPNPYRGLPRWFKREPKALEFMETKKAQIKAMGEDAKATRKAAVGR